MTEIPLSTPARPPAAVPSSPGRHHAPPLIVAALTESIAGFCYYFDIENLDIE